MTHNELLVIFETCYNNLVSNNFPISNNINPQIHLTHSKKYFGLCHCKNGFYTIGINANFVASGTKKAITNTIYHELLHTIPDSRGHDKIWKMYAAKVNELFGYNVCRTGGDKTRIDCEALRS